MGEIRKMNPCLADAWKKAFRKKMSNSRDIVLRLFNSSGGRRPKRKFKAFLQECKFGLVRDVFLEAGAIDAEYGDTWLLAWVDGAIPLERLARMKAYQRINHFPGMSEICKKDLLANNLKRMKKIMPGIFNFFPLTFCLPDEARILYDYCQGKKKRDFFIIKPDKNCQGCGIDLIKGSDKNLNKYKSVVCQKYISMPLLMQSFKMDLRLYVLITSVCPLRVYIYNDGLVRLATVPYKKPTSANMHEKRMHLTNYAINRNSVGEESVEECKKSLSDLEEYLVSLGVSTDHLWPTIDGIIVKTILSALPVLQHMYHTCFPIAPAISPCFELLGFDILLDNKIKPYLLEVNRSPSLGGTTSMDIHLKKGLLNNILDMVLLSPKQINFIKDEEHLKAVRRLTNPSLTRHLTARERVLSEYQERQEIQMMGNFRKIYPIENNIYDDVLRAAFSFENQNKHESFRDSKTEKPVKNVNMLKIN